MADQDYIKKALDKKKKMNKALLGIAIGFGVLIVIALITIIVKLFTSNVQHFYSLIALAIMVVWFGILMGYYTWAIYFYNINLGLTDEDWAEIRERKKYNPEGVDEPKENPNINQTLGLPTGTVRGTVALTLLIGGLGMTIAALGMDNELPANSFLVDNFDFFKTAFLMMIAFYFGNKSLEMLGYKSQKVIKTGNGKNTTNSTQQGDTDSPFPPNADASNVKKVLKKTGTEINDLEEEKDNDDFNNPNALL